MRHLSPDYLTCLQSGFLHPLLQRVHNDPDLDLEIRENSINIYFKGNSLLRLDERAPGHYRPVLDKKFIPGSSPHGFADLLDSASTQAFLQVVPEIKERILIAGKSSLETEYEQLLIRANNCEPRNSNEIFIVDRQYVASTRDRMDLVGFVWPHSHRRQGQTVNLCVLEVKYALNTDIRDAHDQLQHYYDCIAVNPAAFAAEMQTMFQQKLDLGLYAGSSKLLQAMRTLKFSGDLEKIQFILVFLDYNPYSKLLDLAQLSELKFSKQVRIFHGAMAIWMKNTHTVL